MTKKTKKIYILNIAFCDFSVEGLLQFNMYSPFFGDLNKVNQFVNQSRKKTIFNDVEFAHSSIYLTYFTKLGQNRNNKTVFEKIVTQFKIDIENNKDQDKEFVIVLHGHGIYGFPTKVYQDGDYRIKVDEDATGNPEFITFKEIVDSIKPILKICNSYIILNTCFSDTGYIIENKPQSHDNEYLVKQYSTIKNSSFFDPSENYFDLHILGMSSKRTYSYKDLEHTYGINALLNLFNVGMKVSIHGAFDIFKSICSKAILKDIIPNMVLLTKDKSVIRPSVDIIFPESNNNLIESKLEKNNFIL